MSWFDVIRLLADIIIIFIGGVILCGMVVFSATNRAENETLKNAESERRKS